MKYRASDSLESVDAASQELTAALGERWLGTVGQFVARTESEDLRQALAEDLGRDVAELEALRDKLLAGLSQDDRDQLARATEPLRPRPGMGLILPNNMKSKTGDRDAHSD